MSTGMWRILLLAALVLAAILLLLPFRASTDLITVECGNSFVALTAGSDRIGEIEIVDGFERLEDASAPRVQAELSEALSACDHAAKVRFLWSGVVLVFLLGIVVGGSMRRDGAGRKVALVIAILLGLGGVVLMFLPVGAPQSTSCGNGFTALISPDVELDRNIESQHTPEELESIRGLFVDDCRDAAQERLALAGVGIGVFAGILAGPRLTKGRRAGNERAYSR